MERGLRNTLSRAVSVVAAVSENEDFTGLASAAHLAAFVLDTSSADQKATAELHETLSVTANAVEEVWKNTANDLGDIVSAAETFKELYSSGGPLPSPKKIVSADRDPKMLADIMLAEAEQVRPESYGNKALNQTNRKFLTSVFEQSFIKVFSSPSFNSASVGVNTAELLKRATQQSETQQKILDLLEAQRNTATVPLEKYESLAVALGVTREQVNTLLKSTLDRDVPESEYASVLLELASEFNELKNSQHPMAHTGALTDMDERIRKKINEGDIDNADSLLRKAVVMDQELIQGETEALLQVKRDASFRIEQWAKTALIKGDLYESARRLQEALDTLPDGDTDRAYALTFRAVKLYREILDKTGDADAYAKCIALGEKILPVPREQAPTIYGNLRVELASAHLRRHEIDHQASRVEDAGKLLQNSESFFDYDTDPLDWVNTQLVNAALWLFLAQRSHDPKDFEVAYELCKSLLPRISPLSDPVGFLKIRLNLSGLLVMLAERTKQTEPLYFADRLCREALSLRPAPDMAILFLDNQGYANSFLSQLVKPDTRAKYLQRSIALHEQSLMLARQISSTDFAIASIVNHLAISKYRFGEVEKDEKHVMEAIQLIEEDSLPVWSRDSHPLRWAALQLNLASMHLCLAAVTGDPRHVQPALEHFDNSSLETTFETSGPEYTQLAQLYATAVLENGVTNHHREKASNLVQVVLQQQLPLPQQQYFQKLASELRMSDHPTDARM